MFGSIRRPGRALAFVCILASATTLDAQTAQAPPAPAAQKPAAAAADLPSAQSIIDKHIEAIGGRKAMSAHKSSKTTGTITVPANGMTGTLETFAMRPNKALVKTVISGIGESREGFDGTTAWSLTPMTGPMIVTGEEFEQKKLDYDFDAALNPSTRYTAMKTLEKTTFDGREVYKLSMTRKEGGEDIDYYDVKTGLKAGSINTRKNPMGTITVTTTLTDYKKFGDMMQPTTLKQSITGVDVIMTFTSVEFDTVDPTVFELPAEIKALKK